MRALIVGAGTMGRWFADVTRDWLTVTFADTDPDAARAAAAHFDTDAVDIDGIDRFSIVCTAVPLAVTPEAITRYGPAAEDAVIDLSGSMGDPLAAMQEVAPNCERISVHPLFAPENAPGNVPIVAKNAGSVAAELQERLAAAGYTAFETSPEQHDRAMENVQAKVHAAVLAYALAADPADERFHTPVSSGFQELIELVLAGNPHVYADIQDRYVGAESVASAAERIATASESEFVSLYRTASERHHPDDG